MPAQSLFEWTYRRLFERSRTPYISSNIRAGSLDDVFDSLQEGHGFAAIDDTVS